MIKDNHIQETVQLVGKTRFIVLSRFKAKGGSAKDRISNLLNREIESKNYEIKSKAA